MSNKERPVSPFMLGPYYKPQLTSMMSIAHRATGVFLSLVGAPLLLWWIGALGSGPEAYTELVRALGSGPGKLVLLLSLFCLFYHLFNGIRHLVWDSGRALELRSAYATGWTVLAATLAAIAVTLGVAL
jgi:succinate dehydrogenase / fumarate reductase cytochrome b subunit